MTLTRRSLLTAAALGLVVPVVGVATSTPAAAAGDDYPYRTDSTNGSDPWGFTKRQCTSFCAWEVASRSKPMNNSTQNWGNAHQWDDTARRLGFAVNATPRPGSFAHWNANEKRTWRTSTGGTSFFTASSLGHVAWVADVYSDGSFLLEDYNGLGGTRAYGSRRLPFAAAGRFIHYYR